MEYSTKSELRKWARKHRRTLQRDPFIDAQIAAHLSEIAAEKPMAIFVSHDGEPDLLNALSDYGNDLFLPRVLSENEMEFALYEPSERMVPNRYGIKEPMTPAAELRDIEVIAVPGLAFDRSGGRVGFGAGYYDRWLKMRRGMGEIAVFGIAFDWQIVEDVFPEKHDQRVDAIITEHGMIKVAS